MHIAHCIICDVICIAHAYKYITHKMYSSTCIQSHLHTSMWYVCNVYMHKYIHTYKCHTYICTYIHTCTNTYMCACMHACMHTHTYVHTHIRTYLHTYTRTCTHTYIHTHVHNTFIQSARQTDRHIDRPCELSEHWSASYELFPCDHCASPSFSHEYRPTEELPMGHFRC